MSAAPAHLTEGMSRWQRWRESRWWHRHLHWPVLWDRPVTTEAGAQAVGEAFLREVEMLGLPERAGVVVLYYDAVGQPQRRAIPTTDLLGQHT